MDIVAILIAVAAFALLLALVEALERLWAARTSSASSSPRWCSCTCCTRCCAGSGS